MGSAFKQNQVIQSMISIVAFHMLETQIILYMCD